MGLEDEEQQDTKLQGFPSASESVYAYYNYLWLVFLWPVIRQMVHLKLVTGYDSFQETQYYILFCCVFQMSIIWNIAI